MLPWVTWSTVPTSTAFIPSVATSEVIPRRVTSRPLSSPAARPTPSTTTRPRASLPGSPPGTTVTSTTPSEKVPGTDRSRPPCWMTSVWPMAAVTRALTSPGDDEKPLLVRAAPNDSRIQAFGEGDFATAGIYAVRPIILREADEARSDGIDALRKFLSRLLERGYHLAGIPISGSIDVDHPKDLATAETFLRSL